MTYSFTRQFQEGQQAERVLDRWLSRFYRLWPATLEEERLGIAS